MSAANGLKLNTSQLTCKAWVDTLRNTPQRMKQFWVAYVCHILLSSSYFESDIWPTVHFWWRNSVHAQSGSVKNIALKLYLCGLQIVHMWEKATFFIAMTDKPPSLQARTTLQQCLHARLQVKPPDEQSEAEWVEVGYEWMDMAPFSLTKVDW